MTPATQLPEWPRAYGDPVSSGRIRTAPEDFIVIEQLGFSPSGEGEHMLLRVQKRGENTDYVARALARFSGVGVRDISYAGLKDRHALTTQWFCIRMAVGREPDWRAFECGNNVSILTTARHRKKLRRGGLAGNDFVLLIRDLRGDRACLEDKLTSIKKLGVPNYFGEQRFGIAGSNVDQAMKMFSGETVKRQQRGLYLSAIRSFLFNEILARRVQSSHWDQPLSGDAFIFDRGGTWFQPDCFDDDLLERLHSGAIHPAGVLPGEGESAVSGAARQLEDAVLQQYTDMIDGLVKRKVAAGRRAYRLNLHSLQWQFIGANSLQLKFNLPAGCYATSVLREIIKVKK